MDVHVYVLLLSSFLLSSLIKTCVCVCVSSKSVLRPLQAQIQRESELREKEQRLLQEHQRIQKEKQMYEEQQRRLRYTVTMVTALFLFKFVEGVPLNSLYI